MQARIREKREVAKGTLMVTFDLLGAEVDFRPGQYFYVTLPVSVIKMRRAFADTSPS
jgi:NAD(P)H-flavin reductase